MDVAHNPHRPGTRVAGLVLAAGGGRRFGGPKALIRFDGHLLVQRAVTIACAGGCAPVVVVLGAGDAEVRAATVAAEPAPVLVSNPYWATGIGSSLRTGLAALADTEADAALVLLVDMPGITADAVRRLVDLAAPDALAMAGYGAHRGHPVLLGRAHWAGVAAQAVGDTGARPYLRAHAAAVRLVPCADVADPGDVDTREDLARLRAGG